MEIVRVLCHRSFIYNVLNAFNLSEQPNIYMEYTYTTVVCDTQFDISVGKHKGKRPKRRQDDNKMDRKETGHGNVELNSFGSE
jgi:hypothetical protein